MSFEKRGFLSADRQKIREALPERFALVDEVSDLSQHCLYEITALPRPKEDRTKNLLTAALLVSFLQFLSVVNMERAMVTNARSLLRAGFETLLRGIDPAG